MAASRHFRCDSDESTSTSSGSSAYQLILDHILSYPGSYEIPLRTMYTLNCAPRAQPHVRSYSPASSEGSPVTPQGAFQDDKTRTFSENVMAQLQQLPQQPTSLPPSFITSFLRRCFPPYLVEVDFPQALTGIDYLKDLETRRRREVRAAMARLDIDRDSLSSSEDILASRYPGVAQWVKSIEEKERKIDALYTQLYIGLRRWIMINELSLLPFNKHNCVGMLNTLFPPVIATPPTSKLTPSILKNQRDGFFKYIQSVERHGSRVLQNLMHQGKGPNDETGWTAVTRTLGMYLQLANSIINECMDVNMQSMPRPSSSGSKAARGPRSVSSANNSGSNSPRLSRKVDSGFSFTAPEDKPRAPSVAEPASPTSPTETARPKTPSGSVRTEIFKPLNASNAKQGTALERLARGLKIIGRSRTDVTEMISDDPPPSPPEKAKTLRKMKSMGAIHGSKTDVRSQPTLDLSAEEMRRQKAKYEAGVVSAQTGGNKSHEI